MRFSARATLGACMYIWSPVHGRKLRGFVVNAEYGCPQGGGDAVCIYLNLAVTFGYYLIVEAFSDIECGEACDLPERCDDVLVPGDLKCAGKRDPLVGDCGSPSAGVAS